MSLGFKDTVSTTQPIDGPQAFGLGRFGPWKCGVGGEADPPTLEPSGEPDIWSVLVGARSA